MKWKVDVKGTHDGGNGEISIIGEDNIHGFQSYGWFNEYKVSIWSSGGPCRDKVPKAVWDELIKLAHKICERKNKTGKW